MDEQHVIATAQLGDHPVEMGRRYPHDLVVGALKLRELPCPEHRDAFVDGQSAVPDTGQDHPNPTAAKFGNECGENVLDPPVARRWHRQPGAGIDENCHGHDALCPVDLDRNR
ncbi:hypothetical protein [Pseudonocardia sp.]|uniref:hypothetical protein n=1 Tax=Pseudonocardia sp. TaxID=60912 RepID=UPI00261E1546|nr:hypothetical protein [Pseudonocardia sp.]